MPSHHRKAKYTNINVNKHRYRISCYTDQHGQQQFRYLRFGLGARVRYRDPRRQTRLHHRSLRAAENHVLSVKDAIARGQTVEQHYLAPILDEIKYPLSIDARARSVKQQQLTRILTNLCMHDKSNRQAARWQQVVASYDENLAISANLNPGQYHPGNAFQHGTGAYGDGVLKLLEKVIDLTDETQCQQLALLLLDTNIIRNPASITEHFLEFGEQEEQEQATQAIAKIIQLCHVLEPSRRRGQHDHSIGQVPFASALLMGLQLVAAGKLGFEDIFGADSKYGLPTGLKIDQDMPALHAKIDAIAELYATSIISQFDDVQDFAADYDELVAKAKAQGIHLPCFDHKGLSLGRQHIASLLKRHFGDGLDDSCDSMQSTAEEEYDSGDEADLSSDAYLTLPKIAHKRKPSQNRKRSMPDLADSESSHGSTVDQSGRRRSLRFEPKLRKKYQQTTTAEAKADASRLRLK